MRRRCHVRTSQADVYRSPTLLMHLRHWCSSQAIIIKDIQHLRASLIIVYMDFEALMKNSLPSRVYCVCTNCGDGVCQESPPSFLQLWPAVPGCSDGKQKDKIWWKFSGGYGKVSGQDCLRRHGVPFKSDKSEPVLRRWQWVIACLWVGTAAVLCECSIAPQDQAFTWQNGDLWCSEDSSLIWV